MTKQTWIITGASRGIGRALAESALAAGDNVVAAVRRPERMADLAGKYPEARLIKQFDARDVATAADLVQDALDRFHRPDVLVNNAGRAIIGAVEEISDAQLRDLMDLHLYGPAALVRAALPVMRAQGAGTIVQMSSQGGRMSFAGVSAYSASKFALEGWSEALAGEVAPFGIRVMIVEPSRFRTCFHAADVLEFTEASETYRGVLAAVRADLAGADGRQEGDPARAAEIIVSLVHGDEVPLRLPLGRERSSASPRRTSVVWPRSSGGRRSPPAPISRTRRPRSGRSSPDQLSGGFGVAMAAPNPPDNEPAVATVDETVRSPHAGQLQWPGA